ncbi:TraR/DksA family transcriptional regulator [Vibrio ruber]|uniref:TraR/DksA family transcriptional regulator n=1 Tax=Vibrio ruber TaxID=184755 RepID=UPI00289327EF|nr:TraR/DksA family transcriptional regulator [Vibrio ruber]WNJ96553.1 TraR/DksA family transcriptional regulator [Vibrio ruber]
MTEQIDQAQTLEQQFRDMALNRARQSHHKESPDIDDDGNRWCLSCGIQIPEQRIQAIPHAVYCIRCQTIKEQKDTK